MLEILLRGVSTRQDQQGLPERAETVGGSKSSVSGAASEAREEEWVRLCERRCEDRDVLIIYLDGLIFGGPPLRAAVGVESSGHKHGLWDGPQAPARTRG